MICSLLVIKNIIVWHWWLSLLFCASEIISEMIITKYLISTLRCSRIRYNITHFYSSQKHPFTRTIDLISEEIPTFFGLRKKRVIYPEHADIVIIGGGFIGSSVAYWLKTRAGKGLSVVVLEKDITFKEVQNNITLGSTVQHFSLPENIYLAQFGAEFLRNAKDHLGADVDIKYSPCGHLVLATEKYAENLEQNITVQREHGIKSNILTVEEINKKYPWINTKDIHLGCSSIESEGVFEPSKLLQGLLKKCSELGVTYVNAEVVGFEFEHQRDVLMEGVKPGSFHRINKVIYKATDNEEYTIKFAGCVLAAGAQSGQISKLAKIGMDDGLLSIPLPIQKRKNVVYSLQNCANETGLNTPLVMDTSGMWLRRNGLQNHLLCGQVPLSSLDCNDYSEEEYFKLAIEPALMNRYPSLKNTEVKTYTTETYDWNTYDDTGILGPHAYHNNVYLATGFGKYGCLHAPGIGRAIAELIIDSHYTTVDLTRMGFDRILTDYPLVEFNVY